MKNTLMNPTVEEKKLDITHTLKEASYYYPKKDFSEDSFKTERQFYLDDSDTPVFITDKDQYPHDRQVFCKEVSDEAGYELRLKEHNQLRGYRLEALRRDLLKKYKFEDFKEFDDLICLAFEDAYEAVVVRDRDGDEHLDHDKLLDALDKNMLLFYKLSIFRGNSK